MKLTKTQIEYLRLALRQEPTGLIAQEVGGEFRTRDSLLNRGLLSQGIRGTFGGRAFRITEQGKAALAEHDKPTGDLDV